MVVGRAGRRRHAVGRDPDRRLLHALRSEARGVRGEVRLPARPELRGDARGSGRRGGDQHHPERRPPRDDAGRGPRGQARLPRQADCQYRRGCPRADRRLPGGGGRAGARLSAPPREPLPLDPRADRPRNVRDARERRGQHQPRPPGTDRPDLLAVYRGGHAGRRDAADRHPLHRRARVPDGSDHRRERQAGAARPARGQPRCRQPDARARERGALDAERQLRVRVGVLSAQCLRQAGDRLLRPPPGPSRPRARDEGLTAGGLCGQRSHRVGARRVCRRRARTGRARDERRKGHRVARRHPRRDPVGARGTAGRGRRGARAVAC